MKGRGAKKIFKWTIKCSSKSSL